MSDIDQTKTLVGLTVQIVSAHVKYNQVPVSQMPALIRQVYAALEHAATPRREPVVAEKAPTPAVPKKSVFPDYIICLEDGRRMKTLKRHLRSTYDMSPEQYREKWDLPPDYPMVAPNYAARRSTLAKQAGLGRRVAATTPEPPELMEQQEKLEQMPARPWQVVSAPAAAPAPPPPERRPEPTLDSVFRRFPKADEQAAETEPATDDDANNAPRRSVRKPFSKQLARSMRR
jgi:predicted transcriptional regulator